MLKTVTITGADDSIEPVELGKLSLQFPFVEWGILLSRNSQGHARFPTNEFLLELYGKGDFIRLSGHLCGSYVREFLMGDVEFLQNIPTWDMFQRVQINTHGLRHGFNEVGLAKAIKLFHEKEFIFQFDNVNKPILAAVLRAGVKNVSTLFDLSHGAGVLPEEWPLPEPGVKCGYAGGISPDNIEDQIRKIEAKAGDLETWIDMETHVRSNNAKQFDFVKVKDCLKKASQFIK